MAAIRASARAAAPSTRSALARLNTLAAHNPGLRPVVRFYERLIPALSELSASIPPLDFDPRRLRVKILAGIPLLTGEPLAIDPVDIKRVVTAICEVIKQAGGADGAARNLLKAVHTGALDPIPLFNAVQTGQAGPAEAIAVRLGLDPPIVELAAQNTLKVFLRRWRVALEPHVDLDEWRRSECPFCGGEPGLAEIRGVESARYLRCLRCGAGWPYPNLVCAYCGNEDHHRLGVLMLDERPGSPYLHLCASCGRGIKTVVTYEAIPVDGLIVEDLATLPLDYVAE